jgi:hypothetical protein
MLRVLEVSEKKNTFAPRKQLRANRDMQRFETAILRNSWFATVVMMMVVALLWATPLWAQKFTAHAPQQVAVGQQFRVSYTVTTQDVSGFRVGKFPDELEVLMGPSTSTQSSFQIINGRTTQSSSITYTFIVCATKNGTFTIPAATVTADGNQLSSNTVKVSAVGQAQQSAGGGRQ